MAAMTAGRSRHDELVGEQRVEARDRAAARRASASRSAGCVWFRVGAERPCPTWLERIVRRREWNSPPEVETNGAVAEPARHDDLALGRGSPPGRTAALPPSRSHPPRCPDRAARRRGARTATPSASADGGLRAVHVDQHDVDARDLTREPCDGAADHPGPDDGDAIADERRGIPQHVDRGLDRAREHGPAGRNALGHHRDGGFGHDERRLMGEKGEHGPATQSGRAALDDADVQIAVLDRPGKVALLERRPHPLVLARRAPRRGRPPTRCRG